MEQHPTQAELEGIVLGVTSVERRQEVFHHLFRCRECFLRFPRAFGLGPANPTPEEEEAHDAPVGRAIRQALALDEHLRSEKRKASRLSALLAGRGSDFYLDVKPHLTGYALYEALLERSWALRTENPAEMVQCAQWAIGEAYNLDGKVFSPERMEDLKARALGELANAFRVADDLDEAGRKFVLAWEHFRKGTGDESIKARLASLEASYFGTRRWFEPALKSLDTAFSAHQQDGDRHGAGRTLIQKAVYTGYSGQPGEAIDIAREGLALIDPEREPDLAWYGLENQLVWLVDCGRLREARRFFFENRARLEPAPGRINGLKLRWAIARLDAGLKSLAGAEQALREVKAGFEEAGMGFHSALAAMDLGLVLLEQKRPAQARKIVKEAHEVFTALQIEREASGALMLLVRFLEIGTATVGFMRDVVDFIRNHAKDPGAVFEPRP
jgi:tetratricopeptide (TPR) repeat protein